MLLRQPVPQTLTVASRLLQLCMRRTRFSFYPLLLFLTPTWLLASKQLLLLLLMTLFLLQLSGASDVVSTQNLELFGKLKSISNVALNYTLRLLNRGLDIVLSCRYCLTTPACNTSCSMSDVRCDTHDN